MVWREGLAIATGYLLGSIPTAYLVTRFVKHEDIRRLGGHNIGALNTIHHVGKVAGAFVLIVDVGKGAGAVAVAQWGLSVVDLWVMLAGLAAVIGHMWMVFLKFSGGRGMGAAIGAIVTIMSIHGAWLAMGTFGVFVALPMVITRNIALSMGVGLLSLPFIIWLITQSVSGALVALALALLTGGKFLPTALASWRGSRTKKEFVFGSKGKTGTGS